jgi:hypothetical protein
LDAQTASTSWARQVLNDLCRGVLSQVGKMVFAFVIHDYFFPMDFK